MIRIDTSKTTENGGVELTISGNPIELATETLALISCLKHSTKKRRKNKSLGEMDSALFESCFLHGLKNSLTSELECMKAEIKKDADIRSADFSSDEEFKKWFHGGDD